MSDVERVEQGTRWVFTLNNYSDADITVLYQLGQTVKYLVFGKEVGTSGTPHLQGFIVFHSNTRRNAAKLLISNRAHLQVARGSAEQASLYCKKDNDFTEFGSLPAPRGRPCSATAVLEWILAQSSRPTRSQVSLVFPKYGLHCGRIDQFIEDVYPRVFTVPGDFRPHQQSLHDRLLEPPDDTTIIFVVDPVGNTGKSWFTRKYFSLYPKDVQFLGVGKSTDIAHAIQPDKRVFFFDVPRDSSQYLQYSPLEGLKNKVIFSPKYLSMTKMIDNDVHVVVFMNERPDMTKLSEHRYEVINWLNL